MFAQESFKQIYERVNQTWLSWSSGKKIEIPQKKKKCISKVLIIKSLSNPLKQVIYSRISKWAEVLQTLFPSTTFSL